MHELLDPKRKKIAEDIIQGTGASFEEVIAVFKIIDEMEKSAMKLLYAPTPTETVDILPYIQTGIDG